MMRFPQLDPDSFPITVEHYRPLLHFKVADKLFDKLF